MEALTIKFQEKPESLEELMNNLNAFQKTNSNFWIWEDEIFGDIQVEFFEVPYLLKISANERAHLTQERVNTLAKRIKEQYKSCEIEYNKKFYTL